MKSFIYKIESRVINFARETDSTHFYLFMFNHGSNLCLLSLVESGEIHSVVLTEKKNCIKKFLHGVNYTAKPQCYISQSNSFIKSRGDKLYQDQPLWQNVFT